MGFGQGGERLNRSTWEVIDGANSQSTTGVQPVTSKVKTKGHIVIPHTQGLCESIRKICGRYGIQTHFKGGSTIKNLLVSLKDKDPMVNQSGAIYWYHVVTYVVMMYIQGKPPGPLVKDTKSTWRSPQLFITTATKQATPPATITSKK